jgi:hypothetical protein
LIIDRSSVRISTIYGRTRSRDCPGVRSPTSGRRQREAELAQPFGELLLLEPLGRVADPFGHHWGLGKPLGPWPQRD